ncbi:MAG: hypothetical protein AAFS10_20500, partial [Myxococcota bacterium]
MKERQTSSNLVSTKETEKTDTSTDTSEVLQLKQECAALSFSGQQAALRPPKPIQFFKDTGGAPSTRQVHQAAAQGLTGSASQLPHLAQVQQSF